MWLVWIFPARHSTYHMCCEHQACRVCGSEKQMSHSLEIGSKPTTKMWAMMRTWEIGKCLLGCCYLFESLFGIGGGKSWNERASLYLKQTQSPRGRLKQSLDLAAVLAAWQQQSFSQQQSPRKWHRPRAQKWIIMTWIWEACKSMVMMWSAPATDSMLATSFAEIGARLWGNKNTKCFHKMWEAARYTINSSYMNAHQLLFPHSS